MPGLRSRQVAHPFRRLIVLLALAFLLAMLDGRGEFGPLVKIRSLVVSVVSPMQSAAYGISLPVASFFSDLSEAGSKDEVIDNLRQRNETLARQLAAIEDSARRAAELDNLLQSAGLGEYQIVLARVMSIGASSGYGATILIDAGAADGIRKDMTVMAGAGMVGRVLTTTAHTSVVVLIVDAASTVGARVETSGEVGFLSGTGSATTLVLDFIDPNAVIKTGQRLVSYGVTGGIFAPGVPLGVVTKVESQVGTDSRRAYVRPFTDMTQLDLVGVIVVKPRTDPRDKVLPTVTAQPTVTVTVTASANPSASKQTFSASAVP